jgi:hypothetical protein
LAFEIDCVGYELCCAADFAEDEFYIVLVDFEAAAEVCERFFDVAVLGFGDLVVLEEVGVEEGEIVDEAEV